MEKGLYRGTTLHKIGTTQRKNYTMKGLYRKKLYGEELYK